MSGKRKKLFRRGEFVILIILLALIGIISAVNPNFRTAENFFDILRSSTFIGICSIGFLVVMISGGIDISFTATATVAQYVMGLMLTSARGVPVFAILLVPLAIGIGLGMINAVLINRLNVPAIVVTIATLNAYYGAVQFVSKGAWLYNFPDWFIAFTKILVFSFKNADGVRYGLSILTVLWAAVLLLSAFMLKFTSLGRKIYAVGGSIEAAKRTGVNVGRVRLFCYSFLGFIAAMGSIVHASMTQTIAPNALIGLEFNVLSAVVLGGASVIGGGGTVLGAFLGVLILAVVTNALTIMKVPNYWHQVFVGAILLASVSITATREKLTKKNEGGIDVK